jgi:NAD(P)-dependent dehydrogenase (short-subunit alcohol dehydrogenase family)
MKSVVITGAGSGIGKATALLFARNNYHVFLLGRDSRKLRITHLDCGDATSIACDITKPEEVDAAVKQMLATNKNIEIIVNNAGTFTYGPFDQQTDSDWINQFQIHILGATRLTRGFWPSFVKNKKGSIVNVSSTLGVRPTAGTGAYSAMKAAQISWTQSLALEGASHGIRVNCVAAGIVDTPIHPPGSVLQMQNAQPLGRVGKPEEIAQAIYFLSSENSAWTTGSILHVDGGINLS